MCQLSQLGTQHTFCACISRCYFIWLSCRITLHHPVLRGGRAKIVCHKIGHEMDVGDGGRGTGGGQRSCSRIAYPKLDSELPAKMSSFDNTEVLTSSGTLDEWSIVLFAVWPLPPTSTWYQLCDGWSQAFLFHFHELLWIQTEEVKWRRLGNWAKM